MKRRQFLQATAIGTASTDVKAPAIAQSIPEVSTVCSRVFRSLWTATWRGRRQVMAKFVSEATDGKFQIQTLRAR